jgi:hypothetical protein
MDLAQERTIAEGTLDNPASSERTKLDAKIILELIAENERLRAAPTALINELLDSYGVRLSVQASRLLRELRRALEDGVK